MNHTVLAAISATAIVMTTPALAQTPTTFTYQGNLTEAGTPADGMYEFEVRLLDNIGTQIGLTQTPIATATQGTPGNDGANGATGAQGPQGNQGIQGAPGDSHWTLNGTATYYTTGNVGIGTTNPTSKLHINAPATTDAFRVQTNGTTRIRVNANGGVSLGGNNTTIGDGNVYIPNKLGIGTNAPTFDISVSGSAGKTGGGSWAVFSDQRLKKTSPQ